MTTSLPLGCDRSSPEASRRVDTRPTACLRILVAEDDPVIQRLLTRLLERAGHAVFTVNTGRDAVEAVSECRFDVILMDLNMPEMSGVDAMKVIRGGRWNTIPIVALTANALRGDRERYLAEGFTAYIAKPFGAEELFQALNECVPAEAARPAMAVSG